jgi:hypothetical protein
VRERTKGFQFSNGTLKSYRAILQRRQTKREAIQRQRFEMSLETGSPVAFEIEPPTGDPTVKAASGIDPWSTEEAIADVMGWIAGSGYDPDVIAEIERMIPASVFQKLNLPFTGSSSPNP